MRPVIDAALSMLFAPHCAACAEPLAHPTRGAVCGRCWSSILPITPPVCDCCGDALSPSLGGPALCSRCRAHVPAMTRLRSLGLYDGALRNIVHALKYDGRRSLARPLGAMMRECCADIVGLSDVTVPVPLHAVRRRERGFNQAEDLALALGLPMVRALSRVRHTAVQAELSAEDRLRNVAQAFAVTRRAAAIIGRTVVIVDDVTTTGATLDACASVLRAAGVTAVYALTVARTVTRPR